MVPNLAASLTGKISLYDNLSIHDEFIAQYSDRDSYKLIDGELIDLEPTGLHEQVIGFIARKLNVEIDRLNLPYIIPHCCLIRISNDTAFRPDVTVLDKRNEYMSRYGNTRL